MRISLYTNLYSATFHLPALLAPSCLRRHTLAAAFVTFSLYYSQKERFPTMPPGTLYLHGCNSFHPFARAPDLSSSLLDLSHVHTDACFYLWRKHSVPIWHSASSHSFKTSGTLEHFHTKNTIPLAFTIHLRPACRTLRRRPYLQASMPLKQVSLGNCAVCGRAGGRAPARFHSPRQL